MKQEKPCVFFQELKWTIFKHDLTEFFGHLEAEWTSYTSNLASSPYRVDVVNLLEHNQKTLKCSVDMTGTVKLHDNYNLCQRGYVSVCLSIIFDGLRKNYWIHYHETWWNDAVRVTRSGLVFHFL